MANRNPNWRDNFRKPVTLKCKNDWCETLVTTISSTALQGTYCDSCRAEAKVIDDRKYEEKRSRQRREATKLRRKVRVRIYKVCKHCGEFFEENRKHRGQKFCSRKCGYIHRRETDV